MGEERRQKNRQSGTAEKRTVNTRRTGKTAGTERKKTKAARSKAAGSKGKKERTSGNREKSGSDFKRWLWVLIPAALTALLQLLARKTPWFGPWYTRHIFPVYVNTIGRFMSVFPFSVVEILLYAMIVWLVIITVACIYRVVSPKGRGRRALTEWLCRVCTAASVLLMIYTMTCGINYYAESFASAEGFEIQKSSKEELIELCENLVQQINEAAENLPVKDGGMLLTADVRTEAVRAMQAAGEEYSSLAGYYPGPKPVLISEILSVQQLCGVYSPFTIEANYNRKMTDYNIPATACHELSHLKGFAREDEANFIACLACRASDNLEFRYSGAMLAYIYSSNALYESGDHETYWEVREKLCDMAVRDLTANNAYWDRYEGKVAEVSNQVNDTYLQFNNQTDGVKSYGRVVDLLLALQRQEKSSGYKP